MTAKSKLLKICTLIVSSAAFTWHGSEYVYRDHQIRAELNSIAKEVKALWSGKKKAASKDGAA